MLQEENAKRDCVENDSPVQESPEVPATDSSSRGRSQPTATEAADMTKRSSEVLIPGP
jgi:hypothetical protein